MRILLPAIACLAVVTAWCLAECAGGARSGPRPGPGPSREAHREAHREGGAKSLGPAQLLALPLVPDLESTSAESSERNTRRPRAREIMGRVELAGGIPVGENVSVEARLELGDGDEEDLCSTRVSPEGSFVLGVPAQTTRAWLYLESDWLFLADWVEVRPGDPDIVLWPEALGVLSGRLRGPEGEDPPPDFHWDDVGLCWSNPSARIVTFEPRPDGRIVAVETWRGGRCFGFPEADGSFEFSFVPVGVELELSFTDPAHGDVIRRIPRLRPGEHRRLECNLERGLTIAGSVRDDLLRPVAGAEVELTTVPPTRFRRQVTDENGRFEFRWLAPGTWRVEPTRTAEHKLGKGATVVGERGEVCEASVFLYQGVSIEGQALWPDGQGVSDLSVWASRGEDKDLIQRVSSRKEGSFVVTYFPGAACDLKFRATREGAIGHLFLQGVSAGGPPLRVVLEETPCLAITGRVQAWDGGELDELSVEAWGGAGSESREAWCRPDGSFSFAPLPVGEWRVVVRARGFLSIQEEISLNERSGELHFVLGPTRRIRGRVLDEHGAPVSGAQVTGGREPTDAAGCFTAEASEATWWMRAEKAGHAFSEEVAVDLDAREVVEDVVLRLRTSCRLRGIVLDLRGQAVPETTITLERDGESWAEATTGPDGCFTIEDFPPGSARLFAWLSEEQQLEERVELAPGRITNVTLRATVEIPPRSASSGPFGAE